MLPLGIEFLVTHADLRREIEAISKINGESCRTEHRNPIPKIDWRTVMQRQMTHLWRTNKIKASVEANEVGQNWLFSKTTTYIPTRNLMENLVELKIVSQFQKLIDVRPCKVNGMQMTHLWRTNIPKGYRRKRGRRLVGLWYGSNLCQWSQNWKRLTPKYGIQNFWIGETK